MSIQRLTGCQAPIETPAEIRLHLLKCLQPDAVVPAGEVAAGSQALTASAQASNGASVQAASAEEASSSMELMVCNIKQNADDAQQADKITNKSARFGAFHAGRLRRRPATLTQSAVGT